MVQEQIAAVEASLKGLRARMPETPVDAVLILRIVLLLGHEISQMLEHKIRPAGLGEGEFRVLSALFSQPDGTAHPTDLCSRATQSPANMSRICDALVSRELITRIPSDQDRRKTVLQVTAKGEELVRGLMPSMCAPLREVCSQHTVEEQRAMVAGLKRLAAAIETLKDKMPQDKIPQDKIPQDKIPQEQAI